MANGSKKKISDKHRRSKKTPKQWQAKYFKNFCEKKRQQLIDDLKERLIVLMVTVCGNYVTINYVSGEVKHAHGTFKKVRWLLPDNYFYIPRTGTIVNKYYIEDFEEEGKDVWILLPYNLKAKMTRKNAENLTCFKQSLLEGRFLKARHEAKM